MSLFSIFQIASQGMSAQRERLEAASSNLANSNTTRTPAGGVYQRRDVVFEVLPVEEAGAAPGALFNSVWRDAQQRLQGVRATTVVSESHTGVQRYQPGHPDADANGYVTMPDVDPLEETVNMMAAARAFEANTTSFNTAKEMARASLRLGEA